MNIFSNINDIPSLKKPIVTIGSFDGLHLGHQQLLQRIKTIADSIDGEDVVVTFDPHPRHFLFPKDDNLKLLQTLDEKIHRLKSIGVSNLVIVPFDENFAQQTPTEYIENFLLNTFSPHTLVVGYDHQFGKGRIGTFELLQSYANKGHFDLIKIDKEEVNDIAISSTKIRNFLANGEVSKASKYLGYNYLLQGEVIHGQKLGTKLGYPTANIRPNQHYKLIPNDGVYATICHINKRPHKSMTYIGKRPSLNYSTPQQSIEVNLFNLEANLYNKSITIEFIERIRGEQKFESLEDLKLQLGEDKISTLRLLNHD